MVVPGFYCLGDAPRLPSWAQEDEGRSSWLMMQDGHNVPRRNPQPVFAEERVLSLLHFGIRYVKIVLHET